MLVIVPLLFLVVTFKILIFSFNKPIFPVYTNV